MDTRRYNKREKYPALNPRFQTADRRELIDCDYVDKLNDKEKDFLNRFLEETVVTNFHHPGKTLIDDVEERRALYRANNQRKKDIINIAKQTNNLHKINDVIEELNTRSSSSSDLEDYYILLMSLKAGDGDDKK